MAAPGEPAPGAAPRLDLDRPRSAAELLSATFELYARYWRGFLLMALAVVVPLDLVIYGVGRGLLFSGYGGKVSVAQLALLALGPALVTAPLVTAVHVRAVQAVGRGERPPVADVLRQGLEVFPAVLVAVLLYSIAVVLGFIALIVPGVWLLVRWYFAAQSVVVDDLTGPDALRRSASLVDGDWWRVAGILLLLGVVSGGASNLLGGPLDALALDLDSGAVRLVGQMAVDTISLSFTALASTLLFFDLRARRDGAAPRAGTPAGLEYPERIRP